jgi:hypothetical protein
MLAMPNCPCILSGKSRSTFPSTMITPDMEAEISDCFPPSLDRSRAMNQKRRERAGWPAPRSMVVSGCDRVDWTMKLSHSLSANALAIGLAANESFVTGKMIDVEEMLRL